MAGRIEPNSALLVVDVQNDFCPGGGLAVPEGDQVVPVLNRVISVLGRERVPVYASRDWHPADTRHFREHGGPWPPHCVQGTDGAAFHPDLRLPSDALIVSKGADASADGYSPFEGRTSDGAGLLDDLRRRGIRHLYVGGLATDYCVKAAVLDALRAGLRVTVLTDAIRGVDVHPGDSERALAALRNAGARLAASDVIEGTPARAPSSSTR